MECMCVSDRAVSPFEGGGGNPQATYLHGNEDILFVCCVREGMMMLQCLNDWFGDHHMHPLFHTFHSNIIMCIVRCKNNSDIPFLKGRKGGFVRLRINGRIVRKCFTRRVQMIDLSNIAFEVCTNTRKFRSIHTTHGQTLDLVSTTQIHHNQSDDTGTLVTVRRLSSDVSRRVFTCPYH